MENEGLATNRPPLFKGENYDYWKERMMAFLESMHVDMWDVVENGDYIPINELGMELPRNQWSEEGKLRYLLNSKARNALMCALSQEEYAKVHSFKSAKQMWDTLALTYEGSEHVKRNKLSLLTRKYELFTMEEGEDVQVMFSRFQTILNELRSLGRTYDNYDHIDKILRSLSRKWRPQVTALRAAKNLETMSLEELIGTLKVHELELLQDEGTRRSKSLALNVQKKKLSNRASSSRPSSKALSAADETDGESEEEETDEEDEIAFISKKIRHMWRKKKEHTKWNSGSKKIYRERKDRTSVLCYECKKLGHFRSECPDAKRPERSFKKKSLLSMWEDLDDSSEEEEDEEIANLCLMANTASEESDADSDDEVNHDNLESLKSAYHELLLNSTKLSKPLHL